MHGWWHPQPGCPVLEGTKRHGESHHAEACVCEVLQQAVDVLLGAAGLGWLAVAHGVVPAVPAAEAIGHCCICFRSRIGPVRIDSRLHWIYRVNPRPVCRQHNRAHFQVLRMPGQIEPFAGRCNREHARAHSIMITASMPHAS